MRPDDGWLIFALGVTLGWVAGWIAHAVYLESLTVARYLITTLRKLYGWHRARDAHRLDRLESQMTDIHPTVR